MSVQLSELGQIAAFSAAKRAVCTRLEVSRESSRNNTQNGRRRRAVVVPGYGVLAAADCACAQLQWDPSTTALQKGQVTTAQGPPKQTSSAIKKPASLSLETALHHRAQENPRLLLLRGTLANCCVHATPTGEGSHACGLLTGLGGGRGGSPHNHPAPSQPGGKSD